MTKGELVKFLEPFSDDIRIVLDAGGRYVHIKHMSYEVELKPMLFKDQKPIEAGEGHIILVIS